MIVGKAKAESGSFQQRSWVRGQKTWASPPPGEPLCLFRLPRRPPTHEVTVRRCSEQRAGHGALTGSLGKPLAAVGSWARAVRLSNAC